MSEQLTRQQIVEKVKKLLALANGSNYESETAVALNKARELLATYNLSMSDVEMSKEKSESATEDYVETAQGSWQGQMAVIFGDYLNCTPLWTYRNGEKVMTFIGMSSEVAICVYAFQMAVRQVDQMTRKKRRQLRNERESNGMGRQNRYDSARYTRGYTLGIMSYLRESLQKRVEVEQTTALVLVKNPMVQQYMEERYPNIRHTRQKTRVGASDRGFRDGYNDGHKVTINKGIGGNGNQKQLPH